MGPHEASHGTPWPPGGHPNGTRKAPRMVRARSRWPPWQEADLIRLVVWTLRALQAPRSFGNSLAGWGTYGLGGVQTPIWVIFRPI